MNSKNLVVLTFFQEKASSIKKRPEFENCLDYLCEGDTLVDWKLRTLEFKLPGQWIEENRSMNKPWPEQ